MTATTEDAVRDWFRQVEPIKVVKRIESEWLCPECVHEGARVLNNELSLCHLVSKASLNEIAETQDGVAKVWYFHDMTPKRLFNGALAKLGLESQSGPKLVTIGAATTHKLFCARHDQELFRCIENGNPWTNSKTQCLALTKRAQYGTLYCVWRLRRLVEELLSETDKLIERDGRCIEASRAAGAGYVKELKEMIKYMIDLEQTVRSYELDKYSYATTTTPQELPVLGAATGPAEGTFLTFAGMPAQPAQPLADKARDHVIMIATPGDAFSLLRESGLYIKRKGIYPERSGHLLCNMLQHAFQLGIAVSPRWYNSLTKTQRRQIHDGSLRRIQDLRWLTPWQIVGTA